LQAAGFYIPLEQNTFAKREGSVVTPLFAVLSETAPEFRVALSFYIYHSAGIYFIMYGRSPIFTSGSKIALSIQ
jgi:hypothetical protein